MAAQHKPPRKAARKPARLLGAEEALRFPVPPRLPSAFLGMEPAAPGGPMVPHVCFARSLPILALLLITPQALALETVHPELWIANHDVRAIARAGNTLYIAGPFDYVGPATGSFAAVDATSGAPVLPLARVVASNPEGVFAAVPDGAGGWYIGGQFAAVGGVLRSHLAHLLPDGSLDPAWNPAPNGAVRALALDGSTLYVGGEFTNVGGLARNRIAALDAATGASTAWNPNANGIVRALALSGTTLFAGGDFGTIGGAARVCLAALDAGTGLATAWNAAANSFVYSLLLSGATLHVGGQFTSLGGQPRNSIGAVDVGTALA